MAKIGMRHRILGLLIGIVGLAFLSISARAVTALPAGCYNGRTVNSSGGEHDTTIQAAVNTLPVTLSSHTCVVIMNGATYAEEVTIQNFTNNNSSITIMSSPGGAKPKVDPPDGSNAAFNVRNTSVNIVAVDIEQTGGSIPFGIAATSANVKITSVTVTAPGGLATAAVSVSSFGVISFTTVTVGGAAVGLRVLGNGVLISMSSAASTGVSVQLAGASSGTITRSIFDGIGVVALQIISESANNLVSLSTITSSGTTASAISITGNSSFNVVTNSYLEARGASSWAVLVNNSQSNTVSQSTMAGGASFILNSTSNTVTQSFLSGLFEHVIQFSASSSNTVTLSTITSSNPSKAAVFFDGSAGNAAYNTLSQDYITNGSGNAVYLSTSSSNNKILLSTITSNSSYNALYMTGASSNTVSSCTILNGAGVGVMIDFQSNYNTFSAGSVDSNAAGFPALFLRSSSSNTVSYGMIRNPAGTAARLDGAVLNTVSRSTMSGGASGSAAHFTGSSSNTVSQCLMTAPSGTAKTAFWDASSNYNSMSFSSISIGGAGGVAMELANSSSNTVQGSFLLGTARALVIGGGASNVVSLSTLSASSVNESVLFHLNTASNTLSQSFIANAQGGAVGLNSGAHGNLLSQSTFTAPSGPALSMSGGSSNTVSGVMATVGGGVAVQLAALSDFNTLIQSTFTSGAGGAAVTITSCTNNTLTQLHVQSSTGVIVLTSTATVVSFSTIVVTGTSGRGFWGRPGNVNITLQKSYVELGAAQGDGVRLDAGNGGVILIASNVISGGITGVGISTSASAQVTIASNSVHPGLSAGENTFGLKLEGLSIGATVSNNTIALRKSGSQGGFTAFGIIVQNSSGLLIARNRVSNPRMLSTGYWRGINLTGTVNSQVLFNDVHSSGSVTGFRLLMVEAGSTGNLIRNNVFSSSLTASFPGAFVEVSADSQSGYNGDFNDYFSHNGQHDAGIWGATTYGMLSAWRSATGKDFNSQAVNPSWSFPGAGVEDFHPSSQGGRFDPVSQGFVLDAVTALTIDGADPGVFIGPEPAANGGQVNQGSYGQTAEASKSIQRMQVLLDGELPALSTVSASGKTGTALAISSGIPFTVTVRLTNQKWDLDASGSGNVTLTTTSAIGSNLDLTGTLSGGAATIPGVLLSSGAASIALAAYQPAAPAVFRGTSTVFTAFGLTTSSPTASISIPNGSLRSTLSGAIGGTAADGTAVKKVQIAVKRLDAGATSGFFFDWSAGNWSGSANVPFYATATLSSPNGAATNWSIAFLDGNLISETSYYVRAEAINVSSNTGVAQSTFTFSSTTLLAPLNDGQGSAVLSSNSLVGCRPVVSTIAFTAGSNGLKSGGGVIALNLPNGWTTPGSSRTVTHPLPEPANGEVITDAPFGGSLKLDPITLLGLGLQGSNWVLYEPTSNIPAGGKVHFAYKGLPPLGPPSQGPQVFKVATKWASGGNVVAIATSPAASFLPGPVGGLVFTPADTLNVGRLQTTPTMQIQLTDRCGIATNTATDLPIEVKAFISGNLESGATFFFNGAPLASTITVTGGSGLSPSFYYLSSGSVSGQGLLRATATITGPGAGTLISVRLLNRLPSTVALASVSVDTGTLAPGVHTASMTGSPSSRAIFNFTLSTAALRWELVISSDPVNFYPVLARRFDVGNPGRELSWSGIDELARPPRFVSTGTYHVKITVEGGVAVNTQLRVHIASSPAIYGSVASTGAGAEVRASGPASHYAQYAVADPNGYFRIHGVEPGKKYNITASSEVLAESGPIRLTSSSQSVVAASTQTDVGSIPFPTPGILRVSATLPLPAPRELFGRLYARNTDYTSTGHGTVHFPNGVTSSDDGRQSVGVAAATWSLVALNPGTYDVEVLIPEIKISSIVRGVAVLGGARSDLNIDIAKKATLYGKVILPTVTSGIVTFAVQVQGRPEGKSFPTVFGKASIPGPTPIDTTSATYALFGLDPGSWTITASRVGFTSATSVVYISSNADVGNAQGIGGLDLTLGAGGVLSGTITVTGDTRGWGSWFSNLPPSSYQGFDGRLRGRNLRTSEWFYEYIRFSTSTVLSSSSYSVRGLDEGSYLLSLELPGFSVAQQTVAVSGGVGRSDFVLVSSGLPVALTFKLPSSGLSAVPASEFANVSLYVEGPQAKAAVFQDITLGNTVTYTTDTARVIFNLGSRGKHRLEAFYKTMGTTRRIDVDLREGAVPEALFDLGGGTFSVRGKLVLGGDISISTPGGFVYISSMSELINAAEQKPYCLLGMSEPLVLSAAHMEMIPLDVRDNKSMEQPLYTSSSTTSDCRFIDMSTFTLTPDRSRPNVFLGYTASLDGDGNFLFPKIPAGHYILRNVPNILKDPPLPNQPSGRVLEVPELPAIRQIVEVTSNTVLSEIRLVLNLSVSGNILAPPRQLLNRPVLVRLLDASGRVVQSIVTGFQNSASASFRLARVPEGFYKLHVLDLGTPRLFAARPLDVKVSGASALGIEVPLIPGGLIKGKLVVGTLLPGQTTAQFRLAGDSDLPFKFQIQARANPWFDGGLKRAQTNNVCAEYFGDVCGVKLGSENEFTIDSLIPGRYDVHFLSRNRDEDTLRGGQALVSAVTPGVEVAEGRVTDLGFVKLLASFELVGKVLEAGSGAPAAGVPVSARPSRKAAGSRDLPLAYTDDRGQFVLRGLDSRVRFYDVTAAYRGDLETIRSRPAPYETQTRAVDLSSATSVTFQLRKAAYGLKGRVLAPAGSSGLTSFIEELREDKPGALLYLKKQGLGLTDDPLVDIRAVTDAEGRFEILSLSTGTYRLTALALHAAARVQGFTLGDGGKDLGDLRLSEGASLVGELHKSDGANPSFDDVKRIVAVGPTSDEILLGTLDRDEASLTVTGYHISGFRVGSSTAPIRYKLLLFNSRGRVFLPEEARQISFTDDEERTQDLVVRDSKPSVSAKARRASISDPFKVEFEASQPLRSKTENDDVLENIVTTASALGTLSGFELSDERTRLAVLYKPAVGESSFTLRFSAFSAVPDPESLDSASPHYRLSTYATFYVGVDGFDQSEFANVGGGNVLVEGEPGRVTLVSGTFDLEVSSSLSVTLQISTEGLAGVSPQSFKTLEEANKAALRFKPTAYPEHLLRAMAATPPSVKPLSAFYDILLPLGIRTALSQPTPLTISYSSGTDPTTLNLYWYNAAANAYILQQDVTGAAPVIDYENRTITINVNHFSTFVLFQTGVNVISGDAFPGAGIDAFNFPNPFDLTIKTVNAIHPLASMKVRGTMIRIGFPQGESAQGTLRIFNVLGELVRTIDLGLLDGGKYYYQGWDGRNDSGHDVASGVYLVQVRIGVQSKFFKMALIK